MEKLEEAARSAGETTKFSATEAAEAMSYMDLRDGQRMRCVLDFPAI